MHTLLEFGDKSITHCFQTLFKYVYVLLCLHVRTCCVHSFLPHKGGYEHGAVCLLYEISLIYHNWGCQFYGRLMGLADEVYTQYMDFNLFFIN